MDFSAAKDYIIERLVMELPRNLYYHGAHHTFDVVKSVHYLARIENVGIPERFLLLTAAYYHDAGFLFQYNHNEPNAVELVREVLPEYEYTDSDIQIISDIILATQIDVEPKTLLQKIMCDADHDYFGRHDYRRIATELRKELKEYEKEYTEVDWLNLQIHFLENKHSYFTKTSIKERLPGKIDRIAQLKSELKELLNSEA